MRQPGFLPAVAAISILCSTAAADWQYRSRPDLAPPRLNITIPAANNTEQGYLFLAPFAGFPDTSSEQHGPRQTGPYIFTDTGDLIWSGYGIYSIWSTNFQAGRWKGQDILFSFEGDHNAGMCARVFLCLSPIRLPVILLWFGQLVDPCMPGYGHRHGHITFMDQHYETIRELRAGNHKLVDKHEFEIVNEQTGLIQVYQPVPRDLTAWGASDEQQWIVNAIFQGKLL